MVVIFRLQSSPLQLWAEQTACCELKRRGGFSDPRCPVCKEEQAFWWMTVDATYRSKKLSINTARSTTPSS